ncbi:uncharacterized protein LOC128557950 [Mercenaria mercenaria]|uniref:uncharacterized protein LOC128557950 n=1 Tax=Mercenaria mercenaria TaxID=6596 RepID=UPI00234EA5FD|nr:uncharacterized protein LOC128557950 [Mercenaria mercenaria]
MANKHSLLLFLVIISAIREIESADYACKSKPVQMDIIVDWTKNIGSKDKNTVEQIIVKIISDLPAHSSVKVNAASGSIMTQIVSVSTPYANMSWSAKLYDYNLPQGGNSISLAAIDNELNSQFTVNKHRTKAELTIVFVSDSTNVIGTSVMLYKKKAIFVVIGDSIPSVYGPLASTKNHTHLLSEGENKLTRLINSISSQIACGKLLTFSPDTNLHCLFKM